MSFEEKVAAKSPTYWKDTMGNLCKASNGVIVDGTSEGSRVVTVSITVDEGKDLYIYQRACVEEAYKVAVKAIRKVISCS